VKVIFVPDLQSSLLIYFGSLTMSNVEQVWQKSKRCSLNSKLWLYSLANHGVLPHDGKGITVEMAVKALTSSINLDAGIAKVFASGALPANPDAHAHSFDLDHINKHGVIEHDVSLTRDDFASGDNHTFNPEIWKSVLSTYGDGKVTNFALASKARYNRVVACKEAHKAANKEFMYGIKEAIFSYGVSPCSTADSTGD
jgi:Peroxidase, family 2